MKFLLLCAVVLAAQAGAAETEYRIDTAHSYAEFAVVHMNISTVRGKFNHISGVIALDPDAGSGRMDVGLAADAIVTGDATLDRVLSGPEWFNADQFPSVRFVGDKFVFAEGRLHQVDGKLTLLGVTQPVTLTIQRTGCAKNFFTLFRNVCGADATTRISRSAFGLTRYASLIADEVEVSIAVEGVVAGKQGSSDSEAR